VTTAEGTEALTLSGARRMYQRVLAAWAMDLLSLRRAGLDRPGRRTVGSRGAALPELEVCGTMAAGGEPPWDPAPRR
jgi:hypothetical protein